MYSVVMMMALSGGADVPALGHRRGGCCGCEGSCSGYSSGCNGCDGCHGGRRHRRHGHDCCGCHGGNSCSGCHGYDMCGCHGMMAGCYGGMGCYGSMGCYGGMPMEGHPMPPPQGGKPRPSERGTNPGSGRDEEASLGMPATLVVTLPADAKLIVGDYLTKSTSGVRTFVSPALPAGQEFTYSLKAEIAKDGRTFTVNKDVTVRAGATSNVALDIPADSVAKR